MEPLRHHDVKEFMPAAGPPARREGMTIRRDFLDDSARNTKITHLEPYEPGHGVCDSSVRWSKRKRWAPAEPSQRPCKARVGRYSSDEICLKVEALGENHHAAATFSVYIVGRFGRGQDPSMKPMFFGDSKRKLYGVYDAPRGPQRHSHAILLCYPGIQEYGTSVWGFRRLSAMLAQEGHHVLRFDYFGTGDSAGRVEEGSVGAWVEDIRQAALELREISGARQLSILGKRLGGALAIKACQAGLDARRLVLWDPVVKGRDYVSELEMWDTRRNLLLLHAERRGGGRSELLGYPFPWVQRRELQELDVLDVLPGVVKKVAIFASSAQPAFQLLHDAYVKAGLGSELHRASELTESEAGAQGRAQLSGSILSEMASELTEVSAA